MATLKKPKSGHHHKPPAQYKSAPDPLAHLLLSRYIAAYCEWLAVKHSSPDTLRARGAALRTFTTWAHERSLDDPREITKPVLERYQRHLFYYRKANGKPLAVSSQATILQSLRSFFKWAARENHILFNPASELELPRVPKQLPRSILSVEEVAAMLNETDVGSVYGLRDRAILELLYSTGLRRKEVENLILGDIDFKRQVLFVRGGKGGRDRVVPVGARACAWLEKYLLEAREELAVAPCSALFLTDFGDPVSGAYVAQRVKRYMALAGIDRPGAAHLLRHACATHMLEGGADIRFIQALLGHTDLNTTEIYTHVSIEKLKAIHAATHPARLPGAARVQAQAHDENAASALLAALAVESEVEAAEEKAASKSVTA
jgi:integrase/recombinase XerD